MWRHLPATYPAKAASATLQLFKQLTALLQTINCRKAWGKQPTGTEQGSLRLCSLFGMKFTQVPSQYSNQIWEVQARNKVWVHAKAPSHHLSCESSANLKLFKQSTALLQTINCRKVWGKQPTGTEQGSPHCLVWNSHKCPANTATDLQSKQHCPTIPMPYAW